MKNRKGLRRLVLPLLLIGLGVFIGTAMAESDQPNIQFHGDIDFSMPELQQIEGLTELQELEVEMNEMMHELERDLNQSLPEVPLTPQEPTIIITSEDSNSSSNRINVGFISALMGGLGVAAIAIMALITFSSAAPSKYNDYD